MGPGFFRHTESRTGSATDSRDKPGGMFPNFLTEPMHFSPCYSCSPGFAFNSQQSQIIVNQKMGCRRREGLAPFKFGIRPNAAFDLAPVTAWRLCAALRSELELLRGWCAAGLGGLGEKRAETGQSGNPTTCNDIGTRPVRPD